MYEVTTVGFNGAVHTVSAEANGEVIERFRLAMDSWFIESITITKK